MIHAPAHVRDRALLRDVAVDDRPPAADLDQTLFVAKLFGESSLFVKTRAHAMRVHLALVYI